LAGRYEAVIHFDPDTPCDGGAIIDVCADIGAEQLAAHRITSDQIIASGMTARLEFSLPVPRNNVEVRLLADGDLSVGIVSVEIWGRLAECTSEFDIKNASRFDRPYPSSDDLLRHNPVLRGPLDEIREELIREQNEEIKNVLRLLRPYGVRGHKKARFGSPHDGGYVIIDDFRAVDTAFSFGVEQNATWDVDIANRGLTVYQFDHTVYNPPVTDNARLIFARKRISPDAGPDSESLSSLMAQHDKNNTRPNILLKIDIENDEWAVFDRVSPVLLSRFSQIVGEFHYLEGLTDPRCRRLFTRVFEKLIDAYAVVHIHANNCVGTSKVGGLSFPNVLEITFANRCLYSFSETDEMFPGPLDAPNDPNRPDVHLDSFRF
jgi:hypothetical protein